MTPKSINCFILQALNVPSFLEEDLRARNTKLERTRGKEHAGESGVATVTFKQSRGTEFLEQGDTWNETCSSLSKPSPTLICYSCVWVRGMLWLPPLWCIGSMIAKPTRLAFSTVLTLPGSLLFPVYLTGEAKVNPRDSDDNQLIEKGRSQQCHVGKLTNWNEKSSSYRNDFSFFPGTQLS